MGLYPSTEFPLYEYYALCPNARYVGGTSRYLCECAQPHRCHGVIAVSQDATKKVENNEK